MLDDLARALRQSHLQDLPRKTVYQPEPGFDELDPSQQEYYRRMVRAVLVRLKPGSGGVFDVGFAAMADEESLEVIWGRMVEAAGG